MANDLDLIRTPESALLLDNMDIELPNLRTDKYTTDLIGALLWLDWANGIREPGDYVLLHKDAGEVLMYEADIADATVGKAWGRACIFGIAHDTAEFHRLAQTPFMVEFPLRDDVPANIRGQKITVAFMSDEESTTDPLVDYAAVTLHRDGRFVGDAGTYRRAA